MRILAVVVVSVQIEPGLCSIFLSSRWSLEIFTIDVVATETCSSKPEASEGRILSKGISDKI